MSIENEYSYVLSKAKDNAKGVVSEYDRGMQKMAVAMMTTYMMSKEAEDLGVVSFRINKIHNEDGTVSVKSSFILDENKMKKPAREDNFIDVMAKDLGEMFDEMMAEMEVNNGKQRKQRRRKKREE